MDCNVVRLACPVNLDPAEMLEAKDRRLCDHIIYVAHSIIMSRQSRPRRERDGFLPLRSRFMEKILGPRNWLKVRRIAIDRGFVECDESYSAGRKSKGYRLPEPYSSASFGWREVINASLCRRIKRWKDSEFRAMWHKLRLGAGQYNVEPVKHLWRNLQRVRIDESAEHRGSCARWLSNDMLFAVDCIRRGQWRIKVDDFGRVHTNLTNLRKDLRKYLSVDGRPLVNVDIASSQPLFLGLYLAGKFDESSSSARGQVAECPVIDRSVTGQWQPCGAETEENTPQGDTTGDKGHQPPAAQPYVLHQVYLSACCSGSFYPQVAAEMESGRGAGSVPVSYPEIKQAVLQAIYDRSSHVNAATRAIQRLYPAVWAGLCWLKRDDYRHAAHEMQRAESSFVIGRCVARLQREYPAMFVSTIHDSVLTSEGDEETVRSVMLDEFQKLGVRPTLRIER